MHWIYPSLGGAIFGFGMGSISDVALCLLMDSYQVVSEVRRVVHPYF